MSKRIGILYHPRLSEALALCEALKERLQQSKYEVWTASAWAEQSTTPLMPDTSALVTIGGDGTILRAARSLIPHPIPILGIRYGRLGFLAGVPPEDALEQVPHLLEREESPSTRAMLQATCPPTVLNALFTQEHHPLLADEPQLNGLNDVVIARGAVGRPITIMVSVDKQPVTSYRADAVIVATATGSTGYVLAAGGPVLHPTSPNIILMPVSAHATLDNPMVLEPYAEVELTVHSDQGAFLSVDGQVDLPLPEGATVTVRRSPYNAYFIHDGSIDQFYSQLLTRLHFGEATDP